MCAFWLKMTEKWPKKSCKGCIRANEKKSPVSLLFLQFKNDPCKIWRKQSLVRFWRILETSRIGSKFGIIDSLCLYLGNERRHCYEIAVCISGQCFTLYMHKTGPAARKTNIGCCFSPPHVCPFQFGLRSCASWKYSSLDLIHVKLSFYSNYSKLSEGVKAALSP